MKLPGIFQDTSPGKCEGSPFPPPWWQEQLHVGLIQGGAWGCVVVMEGMRRSEWPGRSPREWLSGPSAGLGELRKLPSPATVTLCAPASFSLQRLCSLIHGPGQTQRGHPSPWSRHSFSGFGSQDLKIPKGRRGERHGPCRGAH